jgi:hypothetical protein
MSLALNISWEIVTAFYTCQLAVERAFPLLWLVLDLGLLYTTLRSAHIEWAHSPLVARNLGALLAIMIALGCAANLTFCYWWTSSPGTGYGNKAGNFWFGVEGIDTTELMFWTAGIAQIYLSVDSIAMLLVRGHSGGASYSIW